MNSESSINDDDYRQDSLKYLDLPFDAAHFGVVVAHFDVLRRIADENRIHIDEAVEFIRTLSIDIVETYRKQLNERSISCDEWISILFAFPSHKGRMQSVRLLASIFETEIAGEQSFIDYANSDEYKTTATSSVHSYSYANSSETVHRFRMFILKASFARTIIR